MLKSTESDALTLLDLETTAMKIADAECGAPDGRTLSEPHVLRIDDDTLVLNYKTEKQSSPVRAATVWVRSGESWDAAFHGENLIFDPASSPAPATATGVHAAKRVAEAGTDALLAVEHCIWEAWMNKDAMKIESLMAREVAFVNIFGAFFANKAEALTDWTGAGCDVKSFALHDGVGTFLSPTVGILTATGTIDGTCGGQQPPPVRANTIYVNQGGVWKWAFGFNSLG